MAPKVNPLTADCAACWRLNESSASDNAADATGNGLNLTQISSPAVDASGVFGGARVIAGSDYFGLVNTAFDLQTFTVAGWYKPLPVAYQYLGGGIIGKLHDGLSGVDYSWVIHVNKSSRTVSFAVMLSHAGAGTKVVAVSYLAIPEELWTYIVASWDGQFATLWINGRPHAKMLNQTGISTIPYNPTYSLRIGRAGGSYLGLGHYGSMDDWGYYNTAKDDAWVYEQFTSSTLPAEPNGLIPGTSKTLMLYRADETVNEEALRSALDDGRHATCYGVNDAVDGYRGGARDLGKGETENGHFFETWDDVALRVDVLTAIAFCYKPIYTPSPSSGYRVFNKIYSRGAGGLISSSSWALGFDTGKPVFAVRLSGGIVSALADDTVPGGYWYMLVGTFDGSNVKIFASRLGLSSPTLLLKTTANTTGTTDIVYSSEEFGISATYEFRGLIDEVALMDVAVSDDWVADLYAGRLGECSYLTRVFVVDNDIIRVFVSEAVDVTPDYYSVVSYQLLDSSGNEIPIDSIRRAHGNPTNVIELYSAGFIDGEKYTLSVGQLRLHATSGTFVLSTKVPWTHVISKVEMTKASLAGLYDMSLEGYFRTLVQAIMVSDEEIGGSFENRIIESPGLPS